MIRYLLHKTGYGLLVVLGVTVLLSVLFFSFLGANEKAVYEMTGQRTDAATIERIRKENALDRPVWEQVIWYINDLSFASVHFNNPEHVSFAAPQKYAGVFLNAGQFNMAVKWPYFRRSYQSGRKVSGILSDALPGTLVLAFSAIFFATVVGVVLGVTAALKKNSWVDRVLLFISTAGVSVPSFFAAIFLSWLAGYLWHRYTGLYMYGSLFEIDDVTGEKKLMLKNLILPAFTLGIRPVAVVFQLTRDAMITSLQSDYVRTAKAKGLPVWKWVFVHALQNTWNPIITAISGWLGGMLAGAVFIEYIFGWKGMGKEIVDSLLRLDYPVVMGATICISLLFVVLNLITDVLYGVVDPRIRRSPAT